MLHNSSFYQLFVSRVVSFLENRAQKISSNRSLEQSVLSLKTNKQTNIASVFVMHEYEYCKFLGFRKSVRNVLCLFVFEYKQNPNVKPQVYLLFLLKLFALSCRTCLKTAV